MSAFAPNIPAPTLSTRAFSGRSPGTAAVSRYTASHIATALANSVPYMVVCGWLKIADVLLGQRTVGRASIQNIVDGGFGGLQFKITTGGSFRPNGKSR